MTADRLRFRERPRSRVRFSGTPGRESATVSNRENLPDPVDVRVEHHHVRVGYALTTRLRPGRDTGA
ncbi:hypothetical protein, partial [Streptomyces sp. GC420]|uniref:hypothetical protein n=1 Tax=Streptomyces sp. GC420 TaxID=2697568 RepID=UPI001AA184BB